MTASNMILKAIRFAFLNTMATSLNMDVTGILATQDNVKKLLATQTPVEKQLSPRFEVSVTATAFGKLGDSIGPWQETSGELPDLTTLLQVWYGECDFQDVEPFLMEWQTGVYIHERSHYIFSQRPEATQLSGLIIPSTPFLIAVEHGSVKRVQRMFMTQRVTRAETQIAQSFTAAFGFLAMNFALYELEEEFRQFS